MINCCFFIIFTLYENLNEYNATFIHLVSNSVGVKYRHV